MRLGHPDSWKRLFWDTLAFASNENVPIGRIIDAFGTLELVEKAFLGHSRFASNVNVPIGSKIDAFGTLRLMEKAFLGHSRFC